MTSLHTRRRRSGIPARRGVLSMRVLRAVGLIAGIGLLILAVQYQVFQLRYGPQLAMASDAVFDLQVESVQRTQYRRLKNRFESARRTLPGGDGERSAQIARTWNEFDRQFAAGPREALALLIASLGELAADSPDILRIRGDAAALQSLYRNPYESLAEELRHPPVYLWPGAQFSARNAIAAASFNHALMLAMVGESGTARVMLAGMRAETDDPRQRALIDYTLSRMQLVLLQSRSEAQYQERALEYVRQSLREDPQLAIAHRLLDYLLSLSAADKPPHSIGERPTYQSEGSGSAVGEQRRIF